MTKESVKSESETIKGILSLAREQGVEDKVKKIILKYQDAVKGAKDEYQRKHIAHLGLVELHKTIGAVGPLVVDGVLLLEGDASYGEAMNLHKKMVKLD